MDTEYRTDSDEDCGEVTTVRFDSAQLAPPSPHAFDLPETFEMKRLARWLEGHEINLNEFGERLSSYDGLSRYVVAVANHSAASAVSAISEPTHAAAFLGQRTLRRLLSPLAMEPTADPGGEP
ncbi:MAG: hypothetical protein GY758_06515 [Fuerstiella sp.]|nr:hypothetical protein [Fuerstiella sp.]MCP4510951.1 hypothetical protein [Fuerstiella sp.]